MRIAISQREQVIGDAGLVYDCLSRDWYKFLKNHEIIPIPNIDVGQTYDFDMLILSGGNTSLHRHLTEIKLYNKALNNNIPVLGICHGAFFLAEINNATCGDIEGHRGTEHIVELEGEEVIVNSWHGSNIISMTPEFDVIGIDNDYNIEAFKHKTKPIWGVVWHPERMEKPVLPKEVNEILFKEMK